MKIKLIFNILILLLPLQWTTALPSSGSQASTSKSSTVFKQDPNIIFPHITTPLGRLRGQTMFSRNGKLLYAFRGIPYAQQPQRFQQALPIQPWDGLWDARNDGSICTQEDGMGGAMGSENCLFVNVFFPHEERCQNSSNPDELLPVLVYLHAGAYKVGAGSQTSPDYLLDECVVFVTPNYRLGALGFLTTGDDVIPGNLGLKDQLLAMKWTKEYIQYFRGNPDKITINGISAGASSVSHHVASPASQGLFRAAIAGSGSVMTPWSIQEQPFKYARELGQKFNCSSVDTSQDLKTCLLSIDGSTIIANQENGLLVPFGPTIEPIGAASPFQTKNPAVVMKDGDFNRVPLMIGFMEDESINIQSGVILLNETLVEMYDKNWLEMAPSLLFYEDLGIPEQEMNRISNEIRSFYFGNESIGQETRQKFVDMTSDRAFVQGTFENIKLHSKYAPVYGYVMTYKGALLSTQFGYEYPVSTHGGDGYFLTPLPGFPVFSVGTEQFNFSTQLIHHYAHFTQTGEPDISAKGDPWIVTDGQDIHQLDLIETNLVNYLAERKLFWQNLGLSKYEWE